MCTKFTSFSSLLHPQMLPLPFHSLSNSQSLLSLLCMCVSVCINTHIVYVYTCTYIIWTQPAESIYCYVFRADCLGWDNLSSGGYLYPWRRLILSLSICQLPVGLHVKVGLYGSPPQSMLACQWVLSFCGSCLGAGLLRFYGCRRHCNRGPSPLALKIFCSFCHAPLAIGVTS